MGDRVTVEDTAQTPPFVATKHSAVEPPARDQWDQSQPSKSLSAATVPFKNLLPSRFSEPPITGWAGLARAEVAAASTLAPGLMLAAIIAMAAHFIAGQYGGPPILFALLLGTSLSFLSEDARVAAGLDFAAKVVLGIGVMLLGARVTATDAAGLGWSTAAMVVSSVGCTILAGWGIGRLCGLRNDHAILSAASVAICGTAATLAVAAALPRSERREASALVTAIGVTALGTIAMVVYPPLARLLGLDDVRSGIFIGATIHNVAQVVGAGLMLSDTAAETATIVKLLRVALLVPVVVLISLLFREPSPVAERRRPLIPWFLTGFVVLSLINSVGVMPDSVVAAMGATSSACIIAAVAALGVITSGRDLFSVGWRPLAAMAAQTAFLALFMALWLIMGTTFFGES